MDNRKSIRSNRVSKSTVDEGGVIPHQLEIIFPPTVEEEEEFHTMMLEKARRKDKNPRTKDYDLRKVLESYGEKECL